MKNIMHDFYFERVSPCERPPSHNAEYKELSDKIENEEQYFTNKMSMDDYRRFEDYKELLWRLNSIEEVEDFSHGFRLGALFMIEVYSDENGSPHRGN